MMDKYLKSKFQLFRSRERSFNSIQLSRNQVLKTIYDIEKGRQEIFFYQNLPRNVKKYFPRLRKFEKAKTKVSYEIDLIKSYDLAVWYLKNELSPKRLQILLDQIEIYFSCVPRLRVNNKDWKKSTERLIVDKLNQRWNVLTKTSHFNELNNYFSGHYKLNLNQLKDSVASSLVKKIRKQKATNLFFSHGDLCFSNILMSSAKTLKLIDPRGALVKRDLFLTLYYDLAKLSHSINGNYDGILVGKKIKFAKQRVIFDRWVERQGYDLKFVRLVESSLFLSLLPLHLNRLDTHKKFVNAAQAAYRASK